MFNFPEEIHSVVCYQGAANAVTCDAVSMKNFLKGWFEIVHTGANNTDITFTLYSATDVAVGTNAAFTAGVPYYLDTDAGTTSDTLAKQTDGYTKNIDPATENAVHIIWEIDPAALPAGYDCVYVHDSGDGGHGSNFVTILFHGLLRHPSVPDNHASAIVD